MKKSILALGCILASTISSANTGYVIKDSDIEVIKNQSWVSSINNKNETPFAKVSVKNGFEGFAKQSLSNLGLYFEFDHLTMTSPVLVDELYYTSSNSMPVDSLNDPLLGLQVAFNSELNGYLDGVLYQKDRKKEINVVILDTGTVAHEDLIISGGFDYISISSSSDSPGVNYEDRSNTGGDTCSSGHGMQMAGIIGAGQNNGLGIAGIADVNIYHGRVLIAGCDTNSPDNGSLLDLSSAIIDVTDQTGSTGMPKADIINISVAAKTPTCPEYLQSAINGAYNQGISIVVSAGNFSELASDYTPANCNNVIVVNADNVDGSFANSYSNYGAQVDVSVIGQRYTLEQGNGGSNYGSQTGTSSAAAAVSGMIAVIKQSFPNATPLQIETAIKMSSLPYSANYDCSAGCGSGQGNLVESLKFLEKTVDPTFVFSHAMSGDSCLTTREIEALSNHMDICNTLVANTQFSYAELDIPVDYNVKLMRKGKSTVLWTGASVEQLKTVNPDANKGIVTINDVDASEYDYAIVACEDEDLTICPFVKELNIDDIIYPQSCR